MSQTYDYEEEDPAPNVGNEENDKEAELVAQWEDKAAMEHSIQHNDGDEVKPDAEGNCPEG